jgi:acyl-CoA reductase-like NAD-dependent aldehyde dehydrogenase
MPAHDGRYVNLPDPTSVRPFWVNGRPETGQGSVAVHSPFDDRLVGTVAVPTSNQIEQAVTLAAESSASLGSLSAHERAQALDRISAELVTRSEEFAWTITAESGKPIKWSRVEVTRAASTFRWASEEVRRWSGELQRLDTDEFGAGRLAVVRRFPKGPVLGITPFNFPLNLVAHKVAPAIAAGCPMVLKPAPSTPLTALLLGDLVSRSGLPAGALSVLPVDNAVASELVSDPRLPVVTFTGSGEVGWGIRDRVPRKHVTLELGGNAAAIVCDDWSSEADLDLAADRIATFGSYQAGQSCISVQRVLVDSSLYDAFVPRVVAATARLRTGDPSDPAVDVGPVIDERAAHRIESWLEEAVARGARVLVGGRCVGTMLEPTVVVDAPADARIVREEVFGPVLVIARTTGTDDAFQQVNASRYGLQVGVFTHQLEVALRAHRELHVGGVVVGDVPSFRSEQMPYGGVKESGIGREGVRSAMLDLTDERVLVLTGAL